MVNIFPYNFTNTNQYEFFDSRCQNPTINRVSRQIVSHDFDKFVLKWKKSLISTFYDLDNKVYICSDVWSDHWRNPFFL